MDRTQSSDLETQFNILVGKMYQEVKEKLNDGSITYQMAQDLRSLLHKRVGSDPLELEQHQLDPYQPDEFDLYYDIGWNSSSSECW